MKKSPLSTPCSSKGKQGYSWKSHDHKNRTGYNYVKSDSYKCILPNGNQTHSGNDFIPLGISTPLSEHKRPCGNWHGSGGSRSHRNSGSGGCNHYRNNYHATPKSNFNNSYSPYKHSGKQLHGQKKVILNRICNSLIITLASLRYLNGMVKYIFSYLGLPKGCAQTD